MRDLKGAERTTAGGRAKPVIVLAFIRLYGLSILCFLYHLGQFFFFLPINQLGDSSACIGWSLDFLLGD